MYMTLVAKKEMHWSYKKKLILERSMNILFVTLKRNEFCLDLKIFESCLINKCLIKLYNDEHVDLIVISFINSYTLIFSNDKCLKI